MLLSATLSRVTEENTLFTVTLGHDSLNLRFCIRFSIELCRKSDSKVELNLSSSQPEVDTFFEI